MTTDRCRNGHPRTPETVRITKQGWRICRTCATEQRARQHAWRLNKNRARRNREFDRRHTGHQTRLDTLGRRRCLDCSTNRSDPRIHAAATALRGLLTAAEIADVLAISERTVNRIHARAKTTATAPVPAPPEPDEDDVDLVAVRRWIAGDTTIPLTRPERITAAHLIWKDAA
ncbi:hypothetical protein [Streptomyces aidingensis]|uniref:Uncharacterized protein n=1 Tax=Streptomyces aidingensis TaxID=910347 RepID=A0A1I1Q070_9ACTN|nr:hypothetical protein [Streptomyces aidingensis]SFD13258.1 hypothetical protein SAMN05421773_11048 [Streptomyces aidingensis]